MQHCNQSASLSTWIHLDVTELTYNQNHKTQTGAQSERERCGCYKEERRRGGSERKKERDEDEERKVGVGSYSLSTAK